VEHRREGSVTGNDVQKATQNILECGPKVNKKIVAFQAYRIYIYTPFSRTRFPLRSLGCPWFTRKKAFLLSSKEMYFICR